MTACRSPLCGLVASSSDRRWCWVHWLAYVLLELEAPRIDVCARCDRRPCISQRTGLCASCDTHLRRKGEIVTERHDLELGDLRWMEQAACRSLPTEMFFTQRYSGEAKMICAECPVKGDCLEMALSVPTARDLVGIFAGTNPRQRREMRRTEAVAS